MKFYNRQGELDDVSRTRTYRVEAEMARSAIDCALNGEKAIYASSELTTGPRLYRLLREKGLRDPAALRRALGEERYLAELWHPNVAEAVAFARDLRDRLPDRPLVVTPAPYVAPGWTQAEYLAFWESLVRSRFRAVYFSDDWELSSGCTFELAVAVDAGLPVFDARGASLPLDRARALVVEASERLERDGFDAAGLRENLSRIAAAAP